MGMRPRVRGHAARQEGTRRSVPLGILALLCASILTWLSCADSKETGPEEEEPHPPATVDDLSATVVDDETGVVRLTFTAPSDGAGDEPVIRYDLRQSSESPDVEAWWDSLSTEIPSAAPQDPGAPESLLVSGVAAGHTYFAVRSLGKDLVFSAPSNTAEAELAYPDTLGPETIADLRAVALDDTRIRLTWSAPNDPPDDVTATAYELRFAAAPFDASTFEDASLIATGAPSEPGVAESIEVGELTAGTTYYFGIRSLDIRSNLSALSHVVSATTESEADLVAPRPIEDLNAHSSNHFSIRLTWTAPGDDWDVGTASEYDIRMSRESITSETFDSAERISGPVPRAVDTPETLMVNGLLENTSYTFAIKSIDGSGNTSFISNVRTVSTRRDETPPSRVQDLSATAVSSSEIELRWTAPGDDEDEGQATEYELRYLFEPMTGLNFEDGVRVEIDPPEPAGTEETLVVGGFAGGATVYFGLRALDERGNRPPISNVVSATTSGDTSAPAAVADLTVVEIAGTSVDLTWTAPGDDGNTGTASAYHLRRSAAEISLANWDDADVLEVEGAPGPPGTAETTTATMDSSVPNNYFALRTADEAGNLSPVSNNVAVKTNEPRTVVVAAGGGGDYPTIQAAIDALTDGDTIELLDGVYAGDGNRELDLYGKALIIRARSDDPSRCVLDAEATQEAHRRVIVTTGGRSAKASIGGVTIRGGIHETFSAAWLSDAWIEFRNCLFIESAGHVSVQHSRADFVGCRFEDTTFIRGDEPFEYDQPGALLATESTLSFDDCDWFDIAYPTRVGGLTAEDCDVTVRNCRMERVNVEEFVSVAGFWVSNGSLLIEDTVVSRVGGDVGGAAIAMSGVQATIRRSKVSGDGHMAGVVYAANSHLTVEASLFVTSGSPSGDSQVIRTKDSDLVATDCTIAHVYYATYSFAQLSGSATFTRCILAARGGSDPIDCSARPTLSFTDCVLYLEDDDPSCLAAWIGINGNIAEDPRFCDADGGDLRLQPDSPCLSSEGEVLCGSETAGCDGKP